MGSCPMFFRVKPSVRSGNRRRAYRKRQCKAYALSVLVSGADGTLPGQFLDLSMGGVAAAFASEKDPQWKAGDVVEVVVQSLSHGKVRSPARVVYAKGLDARLVRYGFEFINAGDLYAQLDTFYERLFNRRSSMRVRPSLDRKITLALTLGGGRREAVIAEISATGVGLVLAPEQGAGIEVGQRVGVEFRLPGTKAPFRGQAGVVSVQATPERVVLGLAFELQGAQGLGGQTRELEAFIEARAAEMERWEASWS
jgi:c-di-GMP-binding flagellar brake protein YcgR